MSITLHPGHSSCELAMQDLDSSCSVHETMLCMIVALAAETTDDGVVYIPVRSPLMIQFLQSQLESFQNIGCFKVSKSMQPSLGIHIHPCARWRLLDALHRIILTILIIHEDKVVVKQ
jgi:hypothetical protein